MDREEGCLGLGEGKGRRDRIGRPVTLTCVRESGRRLKELHSTHEIRTSGLSASCNKVLLS